MDPRGNGSPAFAEAFFLSNVLIAIVPNARSSAMDKPALPRVLWRVNMRLPLVLFSLAFLPLPASAAPPTPEDAAAAMKRAVEFHRNRLSVAGGYASSWTLEPFAGHTEHNASATAISIQPPGTTTVGLALVRAFRATGDGFYLQAARETASALGWCQLASGGWSSDFDFAPDSARRYHYRRDFLAGDDESGKRRNLTTLDDNKTQSALLFLLELAALPESADDSSLHESLAYGMDALLAAQFAGGGWPQQFSGPADPAGPVLAASFPDSWPREYPGEKYSHLVTLNDNNLGNVMKLLLRAHRLTGEDRYLASARKLGDFLLRAQLPAPQRGWAQQYDENMHPAWARKFEPPSLASVESMGAISALYELWLVTGEEKYRETIPAALDWLEGGRLPGGGWSRFYEMETNRPLYCKADTYEITYDDSDLPTHYGFQLDDGVGRKIERWRETLERPRENKLASRAEPDTPERWKKQAEALAGKARQAIDSQSGDGYWKRGDRIDASLFSRHVSDLAEYVRAWREASP